MSNRASRFRHLIFAVLVVALVILLRVAITGPDDLVDLGSFEQATGTSIGPESPFFAAGLNGDGATMAVIAIDPLGRDEGWLLRQPSYRYARFGYPWLAGAVVAWQSRLALLGLAGVGLLTVGFLAYVASCLEERIGWRAWLLVVNPALLLGVVGDTAEPIALVFFSLALLAMPGGFGAVLAVLRPSYLVGLTSRLKYLVPAILVAVAAKVVWSLHFGESIFSGASNVGWPLAGIVQSPSAVGWTVMVSGVATAAIGVYRRDLGWLFGGAFVLFFARVVVDTPTNAVRAAGYLPILWALGPNYRPVQSLSDLLTLRGSTGREQ